MAPAFSQPRAVAGRGEVSASYSPMKAIRELTDEDDRLTGNTKKTKAKSHDYLSAEFIQHVWCSESCRIGFIAAGRD